MEGMTRNGMPITVGSDPELPSAYLEADDVVVHIDDGAHERLVILRIMDLAKLEERPFLRSEHILQEIVHFLSGDLCIGVLDLVNEKGLGNLTENDLRDMLTYANAAASIITTRKGALRVMPSAAEVEKLMNA